MKALKKMVAWLLILAMSSLGVPVGALASPIGTDTLIQLDQRGELLSRIQEQTARDDVRGLLVSRGVSPAEVDARISALSTQELQLLSTELDEMEAGGSVLALIGAVFVVLLVLEILGVTNVFKGV